MCCCVCNCWVLVLDNSIFCVHFLLFYVIPSVCIWMCILHTTLWSMKAVFKCALHKTQSKIHLAVYYLNRTQFRHSCSACLQGYLKSYYRKLKWNSHSLFQLTQATAAQMAHPASRFPALWSRQLVLETFPTVVCLWHKQERGLTQLEWVVILLYSIWR